MFSRWYSLMLGFLLIVLGIAGFIAASRVTVGHAGLVTISIVWLLTALISFWFGFFVRSYASVRWWAGIVGAIYFVWGIVQLFMAPTTAGMVFTGPLVAIAGFTLLLGSIGLAAAFVPMTLVQPAPMNAPA